MFAAAENFSADELAQIWKKLHVESVLLPLLWQLAIIIVTARVFAAIFRYFRQPMVVGEICSGLVLGPSLLGKFFPDVFQAIFKPTLEGVPHILSDNLMHWILTVISQLGLVLLLFLIGMEFDFKHLKLNGKAAIVISLSGILLPFTLGGGLAWLMYGLVWPPLANAATSQPDFLSFALFLGTALSITAIPILGRMMVEMGINRSRLGAVTISAAAVDDACGWILLATVASIAASRTLGHGSFSLLSTAIMIAETAGFAMFLYYIARPLLIRWTKFVLARANGEISLNALAALLVMLIGCSIVTNLIGIFAIFGAFLFGAILSDQAEFRESVNRRIRDFVTAFFLPVFFAYTGLRTNIGTLDSPVLWGLCGLVLAAAIIGKFGGCGLAAKLTGSTTREAMCIGVMMNTRALMELIVVNTGRDLGVIPENVYCMLVIMAVVTTFMTTPILLVTMRNTELEPLAVNSGFLKAR